MPRPSGGSLGRTKNILHYIQGFTIFIAWALTIAIWTKGDGIDGRTGWYWGLVSFGGDTRRVLRADLQSDSAG